MNFNDYSHGNLTIAMLALFLVLCLVGTILMIIILAIKGDERKKMVISKSAVVSVIGVVLVLAFEFIYRTFIGPRMHFVIKLNPIMYIGIISIIFDLAYFCYRRKYGD